MKLALVFWVVLSGVVRSAHAAPGDLDPSFGTGGFVTTDFGAGRRDAAYSVAVDPGGRSSWQGRRPRDGR